MKKLSLILVLIMTLSLMVGALTTIAFAAGDGTEANPITVGGEGADYATVGEALAAIGTAEGTTYIKLTGNTTETTAAITVAANVVIYSDATGDERPTIAFAASDVAAIPEGADYYYWVMVDGASLTFDGVQINSKALNDAWNETKNGGLIVPKNGATVSVVNSKVDHLGPVKKDGAVFFFNGDDHFGNIVIENSVINASNRGVHFKASKGTSSVTLNNSTFESTGNHVIQCSITTTDALTIKAKDSTIKAGSSKLGMYNRAANAVIELINTNITATSQVIDARNDKATLDLTIVGGTFAAQELVKLKSVTANIKIIGADISGITSKIVNNEAKSTGVVVNTYNVTYGTIGEVYTDVATVNKLADQAAADLLVYGWCYDAESKTYTVATVDGYKAVVALMNGTSKETANLGATLKLAADLDFAGVEFPVLALGNANGYFSGTFDGDGHTMSNIVLDGGDTQRYGIVGESAGGTFKNLTIENASVKAKTYVSLFIGDARSGSATVTFENCIVKNAKVEATDSYPSIFVTTNTSPVVIKNCMVLDAEIVAAGSHAGILLNDRGSTVDLAITVENVVMTGTVSAKTNAGAIGYMCDNEVTLTNVVSYVVAKNAANASSLFSNTKRCGVTMNNVICLDAPIANADALGNKANNNYVLNNVYVLGNADAKLFGSVAIDGTKNNPTLTINGVAADFDTATIAAIAANTSDAAAAKIAEIFADNAALKDAATAVIPHICAFDQEAVAPEHVATEATCTAKATYYVSCVCGANGTATFEAGEVLPHVYDQEVAGDEYLITPAGCTTRAEFYKSCECGAKGEETFKPAGVLGHLWGEWTTTTEPTVDAEGVKERECATCGEKETKSVEKLPASEAPAEEPGILDQIKDQAVGVKDMVAGKLGCGGSIGGASIIIMIAAAGAVVLRKKED